jgi:lipopolysaccharide biosynthesis protein
MKFAIILHLYYHDLFYEYHSYFKDIKEEFDLYVSMPKEFHNVYDEILYHYPNAQVIYVENKGRDLLPFIRTLQQIDLTKYHSVLKLHTKKSPHREDGYKWRNELQQILMGDSQTVSEHIELMKSGKIGMLGAAKYMNYRDMGSNRQNYEYLCSTFGIRNKRLQFFEGTMFWLHSKVCQRIKDTAKLLIPKFNDENGKLDGNFEHALERIFQPLVQTMGMQVYKAPLKPVKKPLKPIAFYLPQFHKVKENDEWWGENYTEWNAVDSASSLFENHIIKTPHKHLGKYDILKPEIRKQQATIAKAYGVYGFCYYHYWFNGKQLLEKPLELLLQDNQPNLPFCFSWANENWTRTWDGGDNEILMEQTYGDQSDWENHINYLIRFFRLNNYIKINGKPVFLLYRIGKIDNLTKMISYWNFKLQEAGFPGIHIVMMKGNFDDSYNEKEFESVIDGVCEFHPNMLAHNGVQSQHNGVVNFIDMKKNFNTGLRLQKRHSEYYYGAFAGWDNTPRKGENGLVFTHTDYSFFERYLDIQCRKAKSRPNKYENFIFINAWNEWGEGCVLEPSEEYGYKYLEALKRTFQRYNGINSESSKKNVIKESKHEKPVSIEKIIEQQIQDVTHDNRVKKGIGINIIDDNEIEIPEKYEVAPDVDIFLSTKYQHMNGKVHHFKKIRYHNTQEFTYYFMNKFKSGVNKNFLINGELLYNSKICNLLMTNYKFNNRKEYEVIVHSNSAEILSKNLDFNQYHLTSNCIYTDNYKYYFGKPAVMSAFYKIYDLLTYEGETDYHQIIHKYMKQQGVKVVVF